MKRTLSFALLLTTSIIFQPSAAHAQQRREIPLTEIELDGASTGWGSIGKNVSADGKPMSIGGRKFEKGLGVHARSEMFFQLDGGEARFSAMVGVDDAPSKTGTVVFQVVADGEKLFDSGPMKKGDAAQRVDVDLSGAKIVELRVTDAGDGIDSDHANWAEAVFSVAGEAPRSHPRWVMTLPHYEGSVDVPEAASAVATVRSPDGSVEAAVVQHDGQLFIRGTRNGKVALDFSPVGVTIDGQALGNGAVVGNAETYAMDETFPWLGNSRTLTNRFQGSKIAMKTGAQEWTLDVRAYDDGVAWRYVVPGSGSRKVTAEATSFVLPKGSSYWTHFDTKAYEGNITEFRADASNVQRPVAMPVTVELPDGGFACYTEADIMGYSGMSLGVRGRILNGIFEDDPEGWTMEGEIATPWRVAIAVDDLTALVNSSVVPAVCPPPDPKLFPKGILTDWIKPGRSFWTWGFGQWDTAQWDRIKGYVDDAAKLNCQYYTIDDPWREKRSGWHRNGHDEWASLKEITEYAAKKGVAISVWEHWQRIRDLEIREKFFENVAKAGAKGVKIDFMESESHERLEFYRSCLEIAAKHKILVNFHGANKPAGEMRTWPNELTREGIRGTEQGAAIDRQHWAALPFTRLVPGPGDFTPATLDPKRLHRTTIALQLASSVAFVSPIEHWGDSAEVYLAQPKEVIEFIRNKPTVWDETIVLPGSEIGKIAAFARRSGGQWWIGVLSGTADEQPYSFDLGFLGEGSRMAVLFEDGSDKTELKISKRAVKATDRVSTKLESGGGFVMVISAPEKAR